MTPSATHLVIIPSYNTGPALLQRTVTGAMAAWDPVWVVLDGSTDGSAAALAGLPLRLLALPANSGKGAAVRHAVELAEADGFTHALIMDADGQHPAACIGEFMAASATNPAALVLGVPQFGAEAPALRVKGRRISNWWANLETAWLGIGDSLFGFRVYPIRPLLDVMRQSPGMRRFDFDPEAAVRLVWRGVPPLNLPAPVQYLTPDAGGVSHFRYVRDNVLLTSMHIRLVLGLLPRLPGLLWRRARAARRASPPP